MSGASFHRDEQVIAEIVSKIERDQLQQDELNKYKQDHPHLADEIDEIIQMHNMLDDAKPPGTESIPERLGDFRIVRKITQGGMGDIYEAVQDPLDRKVVIKTIRHGRISPDAEQRFLREQKVLAKLHQTNIVPIHSAGVEGDLQYFAMPFIDGATIQHVIRAACTFQKSSRHESPSLGELAKKAVQQSCVELGITNSNIDTIDSPTVIQDNDSFNYAAPQKAENQKTTLGTAYFRSVAEVVVDLTHALQHVHEINILHRDLKPSNIMVDGQEQSWIIDFGLAGLVEQTPTAQGSIESTTNAPLTSGILGTPRYMAPEQFEQKADVKTDVWGLGLTLYEMLTLQPAFTGNSFSEAQQQICNSLPKRPRDIVLNIPLELEAIVLKAIDRNPEHRYQSVTEFGEDLRRWLHDEPTIALPPSPLVRMIKWARRNPTWAAFSLFLIFFLLGGVLVYRQRALEASRQEQLLEIVIESTEADSRFDGWTRETQDKVAELNKIRTGHDVRELFVSTFAGLDAYIDRTWDLAGSRITFSNDDERLLLNGLDGTVKIIDLRSNELTSYVGSPTGGYGPVRFDANDKPTRVFAITPWKFVVEKPGEQKESQEFTASHRPQESFSNWEQLNNKQQYLAQLNFQSQMTPGATRSVVISGMSIGDSNSSAAADTVLIYDHATKSVVNEIKTPASSLAISNDGRLIAVGRSNGEVALYSADSLEELVTLTMGGINIAAMSFGRKPNVINGVSEEQTSTDNWLLATADASGNIAVWDLSTKSIIAYRRSENAHQVNSLKFNHNSSQLAVATHSRVYLWETITGRTQSLKLDYTHYRTDIAFSSDDSMLALPGIDNPKNGPVREFGAQLWSLENGRGFTTLSGIPYAGAKVIFSPDGKWIAGLMNDWSVGIWDIDSRRLIHRLSVPEGLFVDNAALQFSSDTHWFYFSAGESMTQWDLQTGQEVKRWTLPMGLQDRIRVTPDNRVLLMRFDDFIPGGERTCRLRELEENGNSRILWEDRIFNGRIVRIQGSREGNYFLLDGISVLNGDQEHRQILVVNGFTGEIERRVPTAGGNTSAAISIADEAGVFMQMAGGPDVDHRSALFQLSNGKEISQFPFFCSALSPDGRYGIAPLGSSAKCDLFDLKSQTKVFSFRGGIQTSNYQPAFSPDGKLVAWANMDGTITVCEIDRVINQLRKIGI